MANKKKSDLRWFQGGFSSQNLDIMLMIGNGTGFWFDQTGIGIALKKMALALADMGKMSYWYLIGVKPIRCAHSKNSNKLLQYN